MRRCIFLIIVSFMLASCARVPVRQDNCPVGGISLEVPSLRTYPAQAYLRQDISHTVAPGETLWRISKMYDVRLEDIMRANNMRDYAIITGQNIAIPQAAPMKIVEMPLYNSNKWKYIIIHHSATGEGSALSFSRSHTKRGFKGIGYHFTIDNGTCGKGDGQIEISPRWLKQQNGAHCKAGQMNYSGIGICLVGNFSKDRVSGTQMSSLIYLINVLRKQYNIPIRNIIGHGQVYKARTECPGSNFPWKEFYDKLRAP